MKTYRVYYAVKYYDMRWTNIEAESIDQMHEKFDELKNSGELGSLADVELEVIYDSARIIEP